MEAVVNGKVIEGEWPRKVDCRAVDGMRQGANNSVRLSVACCCPLLFPYPTSILFSFLHIFSGIDGSCGQRQGEEGRVVTLHPSWRVGRNVDVTPQGINCVSSFCFVVLAIQFP